MTIEQATQKHYAGGTLNCAEAVLHGANDALSLGLDESAYKLLGAYGAGCGCGSICGAVAACVAVIGYMNIEHISRGTPATERAGRFVREVRERCGSELCDRLKPRFYTPESRCGVTVASVTRVLDDMKGELLQNLQL